MTRASAKHIALKGQRVMAAILETRIGSELRHVGFVVHSYLLPESVGHLDVAFVRELADGRKDYVSKGVWVPGISDKGH